MTNTTTDPDALREEVRVRYAAAANAADPRAAECCGEGCGAVGDSG